MMPGLRPTMGTATMIRSKQLCPWLCHFIKLRRGFNDVSIFRIIPIIFLHSAVAALIWNISARWHEL